MLLVGRRGGPEERLVPADGFRLRTVAVRGLDRDAPWRNVALPFLLPAAVARGVAIIREFQPDVVLGVGGYVMAPLITAARLTGVPYVLHEANVRPGLATRMYRRWAAAVCGTFAGTEPRLGPRAVITGLPLREDIVPGRPQIPARRLLVMGGSQGARRLNQVVWTSLSGLLGRFETVTHLTGRQGEEEAGRHRRPGYHPIAFSDRVPELLAEADLVVTRAGAASLCEIAACGLPAIVVPGTFGGGHQAENAAAVAAAGAAVVIPDPELSPQRLLSEIDGLGPERLTAMATAARGLGRPDASRAVLEVLERVAAGGVEIRR